MIKLRHSLKEELEQFVEFESEDNTRDFIKPYSLAKHKECFEDDNIHYLSITDNDRLIGFFLLRLEEDSVEFRRIVITKSARGTSTGQQSIQRMHSYCSNELGINKIWLDVFEHNKRGQHIYSKLGYKTVGSKEYEGKKLIVMEKYIQQVAVADWKNSEVYVKCCTTPKVLGTQLSSSIRRKEWEQ